MIEVENINEELINSCVTDTRHVDTNRFVLIIGQDALANIVGHMSGFMEPVIRREDILTGWIGTIVNRGEPILIIFHDELSDEVFF